MLEHWQTTGLILAWCMLLSAAVGWAAFAAATRAAARQSVARDAAFNAGFVLPTLVVAPAVVAAGFRLFGLNLLFPVHLFAGLGDLVLAALAPATVLMLASGLAPTIWRQVRREHAFWRQKPFATAAQAYGKPVDAGLRPLVLAKALSAGWAQCLPWLFGELIVAEAIFNAPGLGLAAWTLAKQRDLHGLVAVAGWTGGLYLVCAGGSLALSRRIGRRLEGYL
jgi:ABC-type dipeptide/oligopeptide/nickel transport system permease component